MQRENYTIVVAPHRLDEDWNPIQWSLYHNWEGGKGTVHEGQFSQFPMYNGEWDTKEDALKEAKEIAKTKNAEIEVSDEIPMKCTPTLSACAPSWFNPGYAGECWDEDY